jgi:DNA-nicking Smr family endonuclease
MKILDLHGKTHNEARNLVEEFVLSNETPIKIITGNSHKMKVIVKEVMEKYEMYYFPEHFSNFGAYIIQDKTINESIYG